MEEIGIESTVLASILQGDKTIEGRLGKERFLRLKPGDTLNLREDIWQDGKIIRSVPDRATICITQLLHFETFEEMLNSFGVEQIIPQVHSVQDAVAVYRQFYSNEDEKQYGVVAILFELV